jgi:plasmid stability protein
MPTLCIRDVPDALHAALRERARRERRSVNAEVIHLLERAVEPDDVRPAGLSGLAASGRSGGGDTPARISHDPRLAALGVIDQRAGRMHPLPDGHDYLREGRGGAMYGDADDG